MLSSVMPWYLNLLFLGWAAWPLVFRVATRLHDRGYALARALGLILTTYLAWLLGNTALARGTSPLLPFGYGSVLLSAGAVALVSLSSFLQERDAIFTFLRRNRRTVLFYEGLFFVAFAAVLLLRAQIPHISYYTTNYTTDPLQDFAAEKFTDFTVLTGLLASPHFPPHDPWLAGATMNYYYFGHLLWACMVKLTGVRPEIGYNLALASAFALVAVQAASLGYNLTRRLRWGLLAAFFSAAAGNLDGFLQLFGVAKMILLDAGKDGMPIITGWQAWFRNYDFWRSSRAVENTITEFPAFSFLLGDLHAHVSGLVIFLAGLGVLVQMARSARRYPSLFRYETDCWDELFLAALLAGAMSAANSWDALSFSAVLASVLWAARLRSRPETSVPVSSEGEPIGHRLLGGIEVLFLVLILIVVSKGLFAPYGRFFQPPLPPLLVSAQGAGIGIERLPRGLDAEETAILADQADTLLRIGKGAAETAFLYTARWKVHFGLSYLVPSVEIIRAPIDWLRPSARTSVFEFAAHWALLLSAPLLLAGSLLRRAWRRQTSAALSLSPAAASLPFEESEPLVPYPASHLPSPATTPDAGQTRQRYWALAAIGLAVAVVLFPLLQGWVACLGVVAVIAIAALLAGFWQPPAIRMLLALLLAFTALALFCELFFVDDIFEAPIERINTVFKIYYGMWQIAAVAAVLALRRLVRYAPRAVRRRRALALVLPLVIIGGTYTVMAPVQRVLGATRLGHPDASYEGVPAESLPPLMRPEARPKSVEEALDGLRYLRFIYPEDYDAIRWMRDRKNVPVTAHILEATATQYDYAGRFSTMTGRQALGGWLMHEYGWRGPRFIPERERRTTTTQEIYTTKNPLKALALLTQDRIEYVVLGDLERRKYPALTPGSMPELKFRVIGKPVFQENGTTIYRINLPEEREAAKIPKEALTEPEEPETTGPDETTGTAETTAAAEETSAPPLEPEIPPAASALTTESLLEVLIRREGAGTTSGTVETTGPRM